MANADRVFLLLAMLMLAGAGFARGAEQCQPGTVESRFYAGECIPQGADDCGRLGRHGYCLPGTTCAEGDRCAPVNAVSCASVGRPQDACAHGSLCHPKVGCYPAGAAPCKEGGFCGSGTRCDKDGRCLPIGGGITCAKFNRPNDFCPAGSMCNPKGPGCIPAGATPCGGGYCDPGRICVAGGKCGDP